MRSEADLLLGDGITMPDGNPSAPDEAVWYARVREVLERAYLAAPTVYGGSGSGGDGVRWRAKREVIVDGIDRDGTFLDIGCANGLLIESIVAWAAERGRRVEPYGLDLSERIAAEARRRLPHWADRIWSGNAISWQPPIGFDFVRTELEYVPPFRQREFVARLLRDVVAPGGRLLVCQYNPNPPAPPNPPLGPVLEGWGFTVEGEASSGEYAAGRVVTVAWLRA